MEFMARSRPDPFSKEKQIRRDAARGLPQESLPLRVEIGFSAQKGLSPAASGAIPAVYLHSRTSFPLIYRKRVHRVEKAKPGDLVAIYDAEGQVFAYGLYNPRSEVAVRVLWQQPDFPTDEAWQVRLKRAAELRTQFLALDQEASAYRLIHAEGDDLSGLVVDRFGETLSAEAFSLGMYQRGAAILQRLQGICGTKHWILRSSPQFVSQEGGEVPVITSESAPDVVTIQEFGTRFRVRFAGGHKTGFFCDQRENRRRVATFCQGKTVLDICCYTGGFAVQAKRLGNAEEVIGVDLDEVPLALAKENANLNQCRIRFVQADAFAYLRDLIAQGKSFDVVICDPPKFIRSRLELEEGTRKHFALNRLAAQVVKPGGLLVSCSCAGLLPEAEFASLVTQAARCRPQAGAVGHEAPRERSVRILGKTGAGMDHPVSAVYPEGEYLKVVWAQVD
jgi:23S rRNA (cytosine1962-C5)-methyltransferase